MGIEYPIPTGSEQEEKERTLPMEVTHIEQLEHIFDSLANYGYAVVIGPSHAGKTTFLQDSLRTALERSRYDNSALLDCMIALPGEIISEISSSKSTVILDETSRMVHNEAFMHALKERIALRCPIVICATLFDDEITEQSELGVLLSELHLDDNPDVVTEFPLNMTKSDITAVARRCLPEVPDELIEELIGFTTQPYLMNIFTNAIKRSPHIALKTIIHDALQSIYVDQALRGEARCTWQKVSPEPYPRGLRSLAEVAD